MADDSDLFERINALSHEEEELYGRAADGSGLERRRTSTGSMRSRSSSTRSTTCSTSGRAGGMPARTRQGRARGRSTSSRATSSRGMRRAVRAAGLPAWVAGLLLVGGLGVRLIGLTDPPLDSAVGRQFHSAFLARVFFLESQPAVPERQVEVARAGAPRLIEPPVLEVAAAAIYRVAGGEMLWAPRLLSIVAWILGAVVLYSLAQKLGFRWGAAAAVAVLVFLPFAVQFSRNFQPETIMVPLMIAAMWAMVRYDHDPKPKRHGPPHCPDRGSRVHQARQPVRPLRNIRRVHHPERRIGRSNSRPVGLAVRDPGGHAGVCLGSLRIHRGGFPRWPGGWPDPASAVGATGSLGADGETCPRRRHASASRGRVDRLSGCSGWACQDLRHRRTCWIRGFHVDLHLSHRDA